MRIPVSISTKSVALFLFLARCRSPEGWNIQPYGRLNDPELVESSGLTASRNHPRVFWTHNDDGSPTLFAVDRCGNRIQSYVLPGARNRDWEYLGGQRELVSWRPLTLRFSWDSPSFWDLLEME